MNTPFKVIFLFYWKKVKTIQSRYKAHRRVVMVEQYSVQSMLRMEFDKMVEYEEGLKEEEESPEKVKIIEKNIEMLKEIPDEFMNRFSKAYLDLKINEYIVRKWENIERCSNKGKPI